MALIGPRPRSVDALPPRRIAPPLRPGTCFYCRADLRTATDVALHGPCKDYRNSRGGSLECNPGAQAAVRRA